MQNVKKWQNSGELNWLRGFQRPLPKGGTDSPGGPLPVSSVSLFLGLKFSEIEEPEQSPHPREPLRGTPTAQIEKWEMIDLCFPYTAPVFVCF